MSVYEGVGLGKGVRAGLCRVLPNRKTKVLLNLDPKNWHIHDECDVRYLPLQVQSHNKSMSIMWIKSGS